MSIKVAAYCRVSTDTDEQLGSLESQKQYFAEYIDKAEDWDPLDSAYPNRSRKARCHPQTPSPQRHPAQKGCRHTACVWFHECRSRVRFPEPLHGEIPGNTRALFQARQDFPAYPAPWHRSMTRHPCRSHPPDGWY